MVVYILIPMSLGTAEWKTPNKSVGHMQSARWLFQFLNVFFLPQNNYSGRCNLLCVVSSLHNKVRPPVPSIWFLHGIKLLIKARCLCGNSEPKVSPTMGENNFSQLCLFTLVLATSSNPALTVQQLPDALRMTEERKLSNTNTIKLSGNLIGLLSRGTVAILLWGDNESHHSLLGWKKGASSAVVVCECARVCVFTHACVCLWASLVRWGPISKQHSALTKPERSPTEYSLGENF